MDLVRRTTEILLPPSMCEENISFVSCVMTLSKTEKTSAEVIPVRSAYELAANFFNSMEEFELGPYGPDSFSLSARVQDFERLFAVHLCRNPSGNIECKYKNGTTGIELPLDKLPQHVREAVDCVTFTHVDFGPNNFS